MRFRKRAPEPAQPSDPTSVVDRLVASGVIDLEYYQAQTGLSFGTLREVASHFAAEGAAQGLSPHPLLDRALLPAGLSAKLDQGRTRPLLAFLRGRGLGRSLSPLFDPRALDAESAAQETHPGGALGLFLASADAASPLPGCAGWTLGEACAAMRAHATRLRERAGADPRQDPSPVLVDWPAVRAGLAARSPGRTSVVVLVGGDWRAAERTVDSVLTHDAAGVEVVLVDTRTDRTASGHFYARALCDERIHYLLAPVGVAEDAARNLGVARSTGTTVVFLDAGALPRPGWLRPLLDVLAEPGVLGVQPLLLGPDDVVHSAGLCVPLPSSSPLRFLAGHPPEDARQAGSRPFHAVAPEAFALRADVVAALDGLAPGFSATQALVDLCLRAGQDDPAAFRVVPASVVNLAHDSTPAAEHPPGDARDHRKLPAEGWTRWSDLGFLARPADHGPGVVVERPHVPGRPLRWGLRLPSPGGEKGDRWGDTHFAASLATALRDLGQEVVTYRHGAHDSQAARLDDVSLGLRGLDVIEPVPGQVNVLWVISHPDLVSPEELAGFDLVFAASTTWAEEMTARCGRRVAVLLQATDLTKRADVSRPAGPGEVAVFVGSTHPHRPRQVVADALAAGIDFRVYGPWRGVVAEEHIGGAYVANDDLMTLYRASGLVLSDHHPDMAAEGFLANRLFDAVASGARVVSDPVPGLELFEGAVQPYTTPEELAFLCSPQGRARFPSDRELAAIADRIAAAHSFDARARELLDAVAPLSSARQAARLSR